MVQQATRYQNKKAKRKRAQRKVFLPVSLLVVTVFAIIGSVLISFISTAPELDPDRLKQNAASTLYDMNGETAGTLSGSELRKPVKIEQIPEHVQNAFIAVEDVRFKEHNGLDFKRLGGAVVSNVTEGFGSQGGSTITQQLVKNSFLEPEKTLKRKVQEAWLALQLEKAYTKDQIFEMYINKIYFGSGAYGIGTAAEVYFSKPVEKLTIAEAALLAGLPQRPSGYDPFKYPEKAEKRRNIVLAQMQKYGFITKADLNKAKQVAVTDMLHPGKKENKHTAFIDTVIAEAIKLGVSEHDLFNGGLNIYTTMDQAAQAYTEQLLATNEAIPFPDDNMQAGVVLLDTKTGEVRAIGGSRNSETKRGFNFATQLERQPGSTIKPVLAYGPGIETKKWSTFKQFEDEPLEISGKAIKNWDDRYHGSVSMRFALQESYNIPAVKAFLESGGDEAKSFAAKLGINLEEVYPAYAIGGFKHGISPMQLAGAYSAFGNNGVYHKPRTIKKIVYPDGAEIAPENKPVRAMSNYTAYMVTDMLKQVVEKGTGEMAKVAGLPIAGKTGTTNLPAGINGEGTSDAWFAGYTTNYTAAVWTGYQKTTAETYIKKEHDDLSKLIFKALMAHVSQNIDTPDFVMPDSVVEVMIDQESGLVASSWAPSVRTSRELFVKGTEPHEKAPSFFAPFEKGKKDKDDDDDRKDDDDDDRKKDKDKERGKGKGKGKKDD